MGGALGTLARLGLGEAFPHHPGDWPWGTFAANLLGAAVIGAVLARRYVRLPLADYHHPLLATGLCGGLTTFSAMQLELLQMLDDAEVGLALGYAAASVALGLALILAVSRAVRPRVAEALGEEP